MVACFIIYQVIMMLSGISGFIYKHFLTIPLNLYSRYGADSWVCITGSSSGQGRQFALKFAEKGFNILLIGSKRIKSVEKEIQESEIKGKVVSSINPYFFYILLWGIQIIIAILLTKPIYSKIIKK